jgi:hypothetical protein
MYTEVKNDRLGELVTELFEELNNVAKTKITALEAGFIWKEEVMQLEEVMKDNSATPEQHQRYAELKEAFHNMKGRIGYVVASQNDCISHLNQMFNLAEGISRVNESIG